MSFFYLKEFILFLVLVVWSVVVETVVQKLYYKKTNKKFKTNHFSYSKYFYYLLGPLLGFVLLTFRVGVSVIYAFLAFAFVGTILEWLIGFFYRQIVGQRLWTYHRYDLSGYTSWLCIPLWGLAGALFWLLAKVFIYL
ncbi:MAG: hypothetical protein ACD_22C00100G0024 [uncultured bacterium]|uniref:Uncharacterized protein n=1 Tax=candidate division WWE3 bacterium RBG_16_37_10 TaxID=1802610 RepID=A0A1F4UXI9_UNCKA|nr:MAG: hypothetical protein ACD_22C00100G0024 [uncultured bacterium]OGC49612.1 MAG: hypothetical protein A2W32_00880 [candidate division WWE3 bacterium RBG_16_37_10]